jgi:hypothetical protein
MNGSSSSTLRSDNESNQSIISPGYLLSGTGTYRSHTVLSVVIFRIRDRSQILPLLQ